MTKDELRRIVEANVVRIKVGQTEFELFEGVKPHFNKFWKPINHPDGAKRFLEVSVNMGVSHIKGK